MADHRIVSREEWLTERLALLEREKAFTRDRDALSRDRQSLPWVAVTEDYKFQYGLGEKTLIDLFSGRSQLIVYHFMYGADWERPCKSCSFWADSFDRNVVHLAARDVSFVAVSRAPVAMLAAARKRMGWRFEWVSSQHSNFNHDYGVSFTDEERENRLIHYNYHEAPGISVFALDGGTVYHTYSTYGRGLDMMNATYHYLDLVPRGRDEAGLSMPMAWVQLRDEYAGG